MVLKPLLQLRIGRRNKEETIMSGAYWSSRAGYLASVGLTSLFVLGPLAGCEREHPTNQPAAAATAPAPAHTATPAKNPGPAGQASYADFVARVAGGVVTIHAGPRVRPPRQH